MKNSTWAIAIAVGIALCGYFIKNGMVKFAEKDRCVTVKGLSEREVLANRVVWPMKIIVSGETLDPLYTEMQTKQNAVISYLKLNKIKDSEIMVSSPNIVDNWDYNYEECVKKNMSRYEISSDITVTTGNVALVMELLNKQLDLRKKGVNVSTENYQVQYEYVDLSSLKPEMVEEATKNARQVAEKFAEDADCDLGSIMSATQGQFTIDEDYYKPQYKKIRVVTTISYYLK